MSFAPPIKKFELGIRAGVAALVADASDIPIEQVARGRWKDHVDETVEATKAVTNPASVSNSTWGSSLAIDIQTNFHETGLGRDDAWPKFYAEAEKLSLAGFEKAGVPVRDDASANGAAEWTQEGAPFVVRQSLFATKDVGPNKTVNVAYVATGKLARSSAIQSLFTNALRQRANFKIAQTAFSNSAATAASPGGLLSSPLVSPTAGGGIAAALKDLERLLASIAAVSTRFVIITHPAQGLFLRLHSAQLGDFPVWMTTAVAAGSVIVIDPSKYIISTGAMRILTSREATLHMEADVPLALSVSGSPNVVSAPVRSLWQSDCVCSVVRFSTDWQALCDGAAAWMQSVTWGVVS